LKEEKAFVEFWGWGGGGGDYDIEIKETPRYG